MSEVQIAIIDQEDTQITLAVPGVQGPAGAISSGGSANQVFYKVSNTNYDAGWIFIGNANVDAAAAIAGTKISPNFGSQAILTTGTNTAASFSPTSNTAPTNGVYLPAANSVAISTNGVGRLFVDASGNIGVGTASPSTFGKLVLLDGSINIVSNTINKRLSFWSTNNTNSENAYIQSQNDGATTNTGEIIFATKNTATSLAERVRITAEGRLGIGDSGPDARLTVKSSGASTTPLNVKNSSGTEIFRVFQTAGGGSQTSFKDASGNTNIFIDGAAGQVGIGTTSPGSRLEIGGNASNDARVTFNRVPVQASNDGVIGELFFQNNADSVALISVKRQSAIDDAYIQFATQQTSGGLSEKCRITSDGKLLVGTTTTSANSSLVLQGSSTGSNAVIRPCRSDSSPGDADQLGMIAFGDSSQRDLAYFFCARDGGTWTAASSQPTRLVFSTTADGASTPTERMRITSGGNILIGKTDPSSVAQGITLSAGGQASFTTNASICATVNRQTDDGVLINMVAQDVVEGTISVSGTTVSYNGGHLSRWSQLASGANRTEILRGSVLSNLDEMCEWGEEENEQLNRMKVSEVEGDKNVSGVFQAWDDDDDTYINDFYCAMTGDFIIRIAEGITIERGDLLMSAGDGTAKPQDDDIIRSKTIAKVTSTNVSCTYEDGSYCVPCVLMAC